jgi:hypothetical protein
MFSQASAPTFFETKEDLVEIPENSVPLFGDMFQGLAEQE